MKHHIRQTGARRTSGFTLIEVLIAVLVLMVVLAAIAQLVPASILSNASNRTDSTAVVFAQQELNQFISRPLTDLQYTTDTVLGICTPGSPCSLGDPTQSGHAVGNPVLVINNSPAISFAGAGVAGYSFIYQFPNDPTQVSYDVRWAVITNSLGGTVASKRFILGVIKRGGNGFNPPVTLDTWVSQ